MVSIDIHDDTLQTSQSGLEDSVERSHLDLIFMEAGIVAASGYSFFSSFFVMSFCFSYFSCFSCSNMLSLRVFYYTNLYAFR